MKQRRNLIRLLFDRKRIELNTPRHNQFAFLSLGIILTLSFLSTYVLVTQFKIDFFALVWLSSIWTVSFLLLTYFFNRLRSISIKGDMIIFKSLRGKNEVTHIQSVRSVTTYHFLNARMTFVHFRLDGHTKRVVSITNTRNFISDPENAFRKALKISEQAKERANHKPGSVLQPESECLSFI